MQTEKSEYIATARGGIGTRGIQTQGVSFRHAVELLRADHLSLATGDDCVVRKGAAVKLAVPVARDGGGLQSLRKVVSFYHKSMKNSPEVVRYLAGARGPHASVDSRPLQTGVRQAARNGSGKEPAQ
jgi:hypothetical protein